MRKDRLRHDPYQTRSAIDARSELHGDQNHQRSFETVAKKKNSDDDACGLQRQQPHARPSNIGEKEKREEDVCDSPAEHARDGIRPLDDDGQADHDPHDQTGDPENALHRTEG